MDNFFQPLFQATLNPQADPALDYFLQKVRPLKYLKRNLSIYGSICTFQLVGFDSVDDESKADSQNVQNMPDDPHLWDANDDPPYAYYLYQMYANTCALNQLRK